MDQSPNFTITRMRVLSQFQKREKLSEMTPARFRWVTRDRSQAHAEHEFSRKITNVNGHAWARFLEEKPRRREETH